MIKLTRYCLALDINEDKELIWAYKKHHEPDNIWPEVVRSLYDSGVVELEIYHVADRLFMIMEVTENFSFERKKIMDSNKAKVQQWESLMLRFQKKLPCADEKEKWLIMETIFKLSDC